MLELVAATESPATGAGGRAGAGVDGAGALAAAADFVSQGFGRGGSEDMGYGGDGGCRGKSVRASLCCLTLCVCSRALRVGLNGKRAWGVRWSGKDG